MGTILVVEDDQPVRYILAEILGPEHQVVEAANVMEGIAAARHHRPDLVLLDLNLNRPNDGLEVCRAVRSEPDPALARTPIVILSGFMDQEQIAAALAVGADSYVSKPWNRASLLTLIDRLLAKRGE